MKKIFNWLKKHFIPHHDNQHKPHFLRADSLLLIFLVVVIIEIALLCQFLQIIPTGKFFGAIFSDVLIDLTNDNRGTAGLNRLEYNPLLEKAAQLKAQDMADNEYFAHTSPQGVTPWHWFQEVGYNYRYAGENLAVNFFDSYDIDQAWMNSPKHKKNIISENFTEIGIGIAPGEYKGRKTFFVVQLFGTPQTAVAQETTQEPLVIDLPVQEPEEVLGGEVVGQEDVRIEEESFVFIGTESPGQEIIPQRNVEARYSSVMTRAVSSPKKTVSLIYLLLLSIILISLLLKTLVKVKIQFPVLVVDGLIILSVVLIALLFNHHVLSLIGQIY
jgi:hypothetical protein